MQGNSAQARACYFDVANKWGAFASVPLTVGHSVSPVFGVRYSSPVVTAGGMISPTDSKMHCLWLVRLPSKQKMFYHLHTFWWLFSDCSALEHKHFEQIVSAQICQSAPYSLINCFKACTWSVAMPAVET